MKTSNLLNFFTNPVSAKQKQYEAIRAIVMDNKTYEATAKKFGYTETFVEVLIALVITLPFIFFFPDEPFIWTTVFVGLLSAGMIKRKNEKIKGLKQIVKSQESKIMFYEKELKAYRKTGGH